MKKLLAITLARYCIVLGLAAFFVLGLAISTLSTPQVARAQSSYETLTKDYCGKINTDSFVYAHDNLIKMGSVSAPQESNDWQIKITSVTVKESGGTASQSFTPTSNTFLTPSMLAGGPKISVPIDSFIQQIIKTKTSETSFSIQTTKTIFYSEVNPNDPGGKLTSKETSCNTVAQQLMKVQARAQQQQPAAPGAPAAPAQAGAPNSSSGPRYCDSGGNVGAGGRRVSNPIPGIDYLDTAIGCIPVRGDRDAVTHAFAGWFLGWAIGVSGGLALLLIIFSGFQIMTASGDPQRLQSGRELLTAAISGLILIIFSMFLLRLIGVQILHIPGITG